MAEEASANANILADSITIERTSNRWKEIAARISDISPTERGADEVRKTWNNWTCVKSKAPKTRISSQKTESGNDKFSKLTIVELVIDMVGQTAVEDTRGGRDSNVQSEVRVRFSTKTQDDTMPNTKIKLSHINAIDLTYYAE